MIVTVTLNPTLDKTFGLPKLQLGELNRAQWIRQDLGGKGINVSRALRALGLDSKIVSFVGGHTGRAMQDGLRAAGFDGCFVEIEGETRANITLFDEAANQYTKINEPGPTVGPHHVTELAAQVEQLVQPNDLWAFCGSLPPGAPADLYARLIERVQSRGGRAFLDTSGPALRAGLTARPFALKPNSEEAAELLQFALRRDGEHFEAVGRLQAEGVAVVALSRGADGLILAMNGEIIQARPPAVDARSPVGAGDSALAGLLWAVSAGCDPAETARRAVACGTAAAMQEGTGVGDRALVEELLRQVVIARPP
jgi:1-phosphofructokinase family hexose kinase